MLEPLDTEHSGLLRPLAALLSKALLPSFLPLAITIDGTRAATEKNNLLNIRLFTLILLRVICVTLIVKNLILKGNLDLVIKFKLI